MIKRLLLPILFLVFISPIRLFGQEFAVVKVPRNEIGLSLFGVKSEYGLPYGSDFYPFFFNGINYKRHLGPNAVRLILEFRDAQVLGLGDFVGKSSYQENKFSIGFQHALDGKNIRPYLGLDMIYLTAKSYDEFEGGYWSAYSKTDLTENATGLAPMAGIKFLIKGPIWFSFESSIEWLHVHRKGTRVHNTYDDIHARNIVNVNRSEKIITLNPLKSLSLSYNF